MRCSFCDKAQAEVTKLIAGPAVFICNECIENCRDIMRDDEGITPAVVVPALKVTGALPFARCTLCGMEVSSDEMLVVPQRGFLCGGCVGEIEASLVERRGGEA